MVLYFSWLVFGVLHNCISSSAVLQSVSFSLSFLYFFMSRVLIVLNTIFFLFNKSIITYKKKNIRSFEPIWFPLVYCLTSKLSFLLVCYPVIQIKSIESRGRQLPEADSFYSIANLFVFLSVTFFLVVLAHF